jgi:hypothetical protein
MMFDIKTNFRGIIWINLAHVLAAISMTGGNMEVIMVNGTSYFLLHNWENRNDVARFLEKMEMTNEH